MQRVTLQPATCTQALQSLWNTTNFTGSLGARVVFCATVCNPWWAADLKDVEGSCSDSWDEECCPKSPQMTLCQPGSPFRWEWRRTTEPLGPTQPPAQIIPKIVTSPYPAACCDILTPRTIPWCTLLFFILFWNQLCMHFADVRHHCSGGNKNLLVVAEAQEQPGWGDQPCPELQ